MNSLRTNLVFKHSVENANVGKSASGHDQIVSSPGSIGVEIFLLNAFGFEEARSRRVSSNISSRRNMISSNRISKYGQDVCILNRLKLRQLFLNWLEEWRIMDIGGCFIPLEMN